MNTAPVSSKFQIVIPKELREKIGLQVGTTLEVMQYGNRIALIPIQPMATLKGFLKGINTSITRDQDRI